MEARFTNVTRAEYALGSEAIPHQRAVYASWHSDDVGIDVGTMTWVRQFKTDLESRDLDYRGLPVKALVEVEPGQAGAYNAARRDEIDTSKLACVTDFVAVLTSRYFVVLKRQDKLTELQWIMECIEQGDFPCTLWAAALHTISFRGKLIGGRPYESFLAWHATRESLLDPFPPHRPGSRELADAIHVCVDRILSHAEICEICEGLKKNRIAVQQILR